MAEPQLIFAFSHDSAGDTPWGFEGGNEENPIPRLYGLPVEFSPEAKDVPCWDVINFDLEKEPGVPKRYPYFRLFE